MYPTKLAAINQPTLPNAPAKSSCDPIAFAINEQTANGVTLCLGGGFEEKDKGRGRVCV
jgi:hypothetical protein